MFFLFHKEGSSAFLHFHICSNQTGLEILLTFRRLTFMHKFWEQNFYQYMAVYFVQIWTYKTMDKKAHIFNGE